MGGYEYGENVKYLSTVIIFIQPIYSNTIQVLKWYLQLQFLSAFLQLGLFVFKNCVQVHRSSLNIICYTIVLKYSQYNIHFHTICVNNNKYNCFKIFGIQ